MSPTGPGDGSRADVELRLPADSAYVSVLRTTSAGLAARLDFTLDDIEDLRMAVGEASALVLPEAEPGSDLLCEFFMRPGELTIQVGVPSRQPTPPDEDSFAWQVLTTLATKASASTEDHRFTITLSMQSALQESAPHDMDADPTKDESPTRPAAWRPPGGEVPSSSRSCATSHLGRRAATSAREGLVHLHLPLVEHCARRFRNRGEPFEDLVQVGTIGLLKSIDRFDLDRGVEFSTYATPTIIGEIKRYFRDKGWAIRVPRRLQELRMQIGSASAELTQRLGRSPTPRELAEQIGCSVEDILEGIESSNAYSTLSLDASDDSEDGAATMLDAIGVDDENLEHVEIRESIKPLLDRLDAREKRILLLRFFKNMTQSQIAEEIGVSQMHVSRLLSRTLEQLRTSPGRSPARGLSGLA